MRLLEDVRTAKAHQVPVIALVVQPQPGGSGIVVLDLEAVVDDLEPAPPEGVIRRRERRVRKQGDCAAVASADCVASCVTSC